MCKQLLLIIHVLAWLIAGSATMYAQEDANRALRRFDLSRWKLTLPIADSGSKKPMEISDEQLQRFQDPRHFFISSAEGRPLVFRAHCDGVTTKNSQYPRCELRELQASGESDAAWSTDSESLHTMQLRMAISHVPDVKQHVVAAQIHDADDDLLMLRLEGTKLFVERNDLPVVMLERKYKLGTPFDLQITAGQARVRLSYQGQEMLSWKVSRDGCYFKAGCYTQSNFSKGDTSESYGEVLIYRLQLSNQNRS
ncbi:polysaccharide lyase family 7 protein [Neorhodopirellula pilleata]|uniref:Alginate lyase n=1 Tax=Neorhodopirellula pilleata TaxID=2714738 RepID=A0A5C5ZFB2_9BACT|nr:polysaccharide lyase family 7 protein [Neorhodopirellula pilleata]TWT86064.1 Alginate lyase precursor [Neorhodopirellula pilleata]